MQNYHGIVANGNNAMEEAAMRLPLPNWGLDRLRTSSGNGQSGSNGGVNKRSDRSSPAATRSYCQMCNT